MPGRDAELVCCVFEEAGRRVLTLCVCVANQHLGGGFANRREALWRNTPMGRGDDDVSPRLYGGGAADVAPRPDGRVARWVHQPGVLECTYRAFGERTAKSEAFELFWEAFWEL